MLTEGHVPQQLPVGPPGATAGLVEPVTRRGHHQGLDIVADPLVVPGAPSRAARHHAAPPPVQPVPTDGGQRARAAAGGDGPSAAMAGRGDGRGDDVQVHIELRVIPGCPGAQDAADLLRAALGDVGLAHVGFTMVVIDSEQVVQAMTFGGSPSFVVDGTDLFAATTRAPAALSCRLYPTPEGPRNIPTLGQLRQALKTRAGATGAEPATDRT